MFDRWSMASVVLVGMLVALEDATAQENTKYPGMSRQWIRIDGAQFDPSRPPGRGQQAPLIPEYQAKLEKIFADRAVGSLE